MTSESASESATIRCSSRSLADFTVGVADAAVPMLAVFVLIAGEARFNRRATPPAHPGTGGPTATPGSPPRR